MVTKISVTKPDGTLVGRAERIAKKADYSKSFMVVVDSERTPMDSLKIAQEHLFQLAGGDYRVEYYVIG